MADKSRAGTNKVRLGSEQAGVIVELAGVPEVNDTVTITVNNFYAHTSGGSFYRMGDTLEVTHDEGYDDNESIYLRGVRGPI